MEPDFVAELVEQQLLPTPSGLGRRVLRLRSSGQAVADFPLQFGEPFERHRRRVAVHTEVRAFLVEAGLAQHQVTVGPTGSPLREPFRDSVHGFGEGEQRVAVLGRTLQHGDRHATDSPGIVLSADFLVVDEAGGSPFGPHSTVDGFEGDQVGHRRRPGPSRKQVRIGDDLVVRAADAAPGTLVRVGDPLDLSRGQLETGQLSEQVTAWLLVRRPAFTGLLQRLGVLLLLALLPTFEDRQDVFPGVLALVEHRHENLPLEGGAGFAAEVLKHAADAGERATVLPDFRENVVEPDEMPVPIAGDFALVLHGLDRLHQPLQRPDRQIVAELFGDVGEVQHRPFRDEAEDVLRVVTGLEVFVVGEPEALVLEVVRDAAGPDGILVRELRRLGSEVKLRADLRDAADAQQDAVQALIERVAVVAVEEDERLVLFQLSPKILEQCDLPVGFKDPAELLVLLVATPGCRAFRPRR